MAGANSDCGDSERPCFSPLRRLRGGAGVGVAAGVCACVTPHPQPSPARGEGEQGEGREDFLAPGGCGFGRSGIGWGAAASWGKFFAVDFRARCAAASPPARRSQELSGGGCNPVAEPRPLSPRLMAGLSNSASAGPIGCTSGRWALDFGVLTGFFGRSGFFAMSRIWDEFGAEKRAKRRERHALRFERVSEQKSDEIDLIRSGGQVTLPLPARGQR